MVTIKCTPYQKGDLIRYLDYTKTKKYEDFENNELKKEELEYTIRTINNLIDIVRGKVVEDYLNTPAKAYREKYGKSKDDNKGEIKWWRKM